MSANPDQFILIKGRTDDPTKVRIKRSQFPVQKSGIVQESVVGCGCVRLSDPWKEQVLLLLLRYRLLKLWKHLSLESYRV